MKTYLFLFAFLLVFCSFSVTTSDSESEKAIAAINGFYDGMKTFDYTEMQKYCADDFSLIDAGVFYKDFDAMVENLKNYEGAKMEIKIEPFQSDFDGKHGLILLKWTVDAEMGDQKMHITALESYELEKEHGKWLISFIHSTPVES